MLKEGNQIVLKKKLNELIKGKSEDLIRSIKDQIAGQLNNLKVLLKKL